MNKAFDAFTWYNRPDIRSPLAAIFLNKINTALDTIDDRVVGFDTSKANAADLLTDIVNIAYDTTTGVWTFTRRNGTTVTVDQNIEKIPVSFSMDANGIITMTTADGTSYTADVGSLIKLYSFIDSSVIDFTVTEDASGNKSVTAGIIDGSITGAKLQPNYLADITVQAQNAASSASSASGSATNAAYDADLAKSYSIGDETVRPGSSTDNAKYYKEQAQIAAQQALSAGGHTIKDAAGTSYTKRTNLQFLNATVTDDALSDATKILVGITDTEWTAIQALLA